VGSGDGEGFTVNTPVPGGSGDLAYRSLIEHVAGGLIAAWEPQLLLVSAGFDAHRLDPLAQLQLETEDYAWITRRICDLADEHAQGRMVSVLEGGYSLDALRESVAAHVAELMKAPF
jgi:acetoin utilization deacetylase AcuC-like enzyme